VILRKGLFVSLLVVSLVGAACGSDDDNGGTASAGTGATNPGTTAAAGGGSAVDVTEKDFAVAVSPSSAQSGDITFNINNEGPSTHEFVIFKTDLAPDALPTNDDGTVDEEGKGVEHIDEVEDIASGSEATLDVNLEPGSYVFICNLPGHYQAGMHTAFTVS
jgi:uncharacterized cupredoxin-like copper-binding protein